MRALLRILHKKELYRHCRSCDPAPSDTSKSEHYTSDGRLMLEVAMNLTMNMMTEELKTAVLNHMFSDTVTSIVKKDSIMLQFGLIFLKGNWALEGTMTLPNV